MSDVLDFVSKRKESIEKKRRNFERVMFENILGAYSVIDEAGTLFPVELVDISHSGCLFQVPWNMDSKSKLEEGHELTLRMYFSKKSYIPIIAKVKYSSEYINDDQTYMRYGAEFDESMPSFRALKSFIDFVYEFAEHSVIDHGDPKTYFL